MRPPAGDRGKGDDVQYLMPPAPSARLPLARLLAVAGVVVLLLCALWYALAPLAGAGRAALPLLVRARGAWVAGAAACQGMVYVCVAGMVQAGLPRRASRRGLVGAGAAFLWANRALPGPAVAGVATLTLALGRQRRAPFPPADAQGAAALFYVADYVSFFALAAGLVVALGLRPGGVRASLPLSALLAAGGVVLAGALGAWWVLRSPRQVAGLVGRIAPVLVRPLRGRWAGADDAPAHAVGAVTAFYLRWQALTQKPGPLAAACLWGLAMHTAEAGTVACAVGAFGVNTPPFAGAGAAYIAGNLAAMVSFLPAGLGFFEGAMGATLHLIGGASVAQAGLATLLYRLLSVVLPLPFLLRVARQALLPRRQPGTQNSG